MKLNRIQQQIFRKLGKEKGLEIDEYIKQHSMEFLEAQRDSLEHLSEKEGDCWINKAYLQSLS